MYVLEKTFISCKTWVSSSCLLNNKICISWSYLFESFTIATMTGLSLRNNRVTNEHGYVLFVVISISPLSHACLTTELLTRISRRRVPLAVQELLTHSDVKHDFHTRLYSFSNNTKDATIGAGFLALPEHQSSPMDFLRNSFCSIISFLCNVL